MMKDFQKLGFELRSAAKDLVREFMKASTSCQPGRLGLKQSVIFRQSGLDWGDYEKAESSRQQFWAIALFANSRRKE